jgi:superfamily I DNA/RNA helicase
MLNLSSEQQEAIRFSGKFILQACPGSGKTLTVAHRLAQKISSWQLSYSGVAALSFTNVAYEQISRELQNLGFGVAPCYPHFLGTIDHFTNTYIFLPFGHLVMRCQERPKIVGLHHNLWDPNVKSWQYQKKECYEECGLVDFMDISYDINGNIVGVNSACQFDKLHCKNLKTRFNRFGFATQADANFWAMKVLEIYPSIARALGKRFSEIVIDEAQDTSDIQMRIVDLLVQQGLNEVMLVGDGDQAIYEWREAHPEVFISKQKSDGWKSSLYLTENRRSSQLICDVARHFSSHLGANMKATGDYAKCGILPMMIFYNLEKISELKTWFIECCRGNGIDPKPETIAILVRVNRLLSLITGMVKPEFPWKGSLVRLLAASSYYRDIGEYKNARDYLQEALTEICFDERHIVGHKLDGLILATVGENKWGNGLWALLNLLPGSDLPLEIWVKTTSDILSKWLSQNGWPIKHQINLAQGVKSSIKRTKEHWKQPVRLFFVESKIIEENTAIETIHSAKGKTYEAVLYIITDRRGRKGRVKDINNNHLEDEEVRTAYVAMTRPRKLLVIAVEEGTKVEELSRFPDWLKPPKYLTNSAKASQLTFPIL